MRQRIRTLFTTAGVILLPALAFAQDHDHVEQPMNDHDKSIQSWAWIMLAALIVVPIVLYQLRKWQTLRSGNQTHGTGYHQE